MIRDPRTDNDEAASQPTRWRQKLASLVGHGLVAVAIVAAADVVHLRLILLLGVPALVAGWRRDGTAPFGLFVGATVAAVWRWKPKIEAEILGYAQLEPLTEIGNYVALIIMVVASWPALVLLITVPWVLGRAVSPYRHRGRLSAWAWLCVAVVACALVSLYAVSWGALSWWC